MRLFLVFVLAVIFLTASCKKSNESSLCFTRSATQLIIENNTNNVVYVKPFGQNILPLIDWIPVCGNNNVQPNNSISLDLSSIIGYSSNDKLVVYWWECTNGNMKQMNNVILDNDQTVCQ